MRKHLLALPVVMVAGCAGPAAPPDVFHRVEPAVSAVRLSRPVLPGVLDVERLAADGAVAERAIAFSVRDGGPLSHYKYDYWSDPPAVMVQDRLAAVLGKAGVADRVVTPDLGLLADWVVRGKILRFEQVAEGGRALLSIRLAIVSARDGKVALLGDYGADVQAGSDRVEALAPAMEKALTQVFERVLADLGRAP